MNQTNIRFSTDILRRLGEELNPNADRGIVELVKNSYDADATECVVQLSNTDDRGGSIRIVDNGEGMSSEDIENGWLVLGRSAKQRESRTKLGRIPAGSKGLGRLAALRLGSTATLITRPRDLAGTEHTLEIDWDRYSDARVVEDVGLSVSSSSSHSAGWQPGTEVQVNKLRKRILRSEVNSIARELILLADPFSVDPAGFVPKLIAPEFSDLEQKVRNRYFAEADYHLNATIDLDGKARARVLDWRDQVLFEAAHEELTAQRKGRQYACPACEFDIWIFILNSKTYIARRSPLGDIREWLATFGGVHIYENGLRVSPYGDPGNDWLEMNVSRARSPEERPSTNTSIGRVSINDSAGVMLQKTDRSGFIESEIFADLKQFARDALDWLAKRRMEVAEERRSKTRQEAPKQVSQSKKHIEEVIKSAPPKLKGEVIQAFHAYEKTRDREVHNLQREVQLYRTLSTAGISAATFAHESRGTALKVILQSVRTIEKRARKELRKNAMDLLDRPIKAIVSAVERLSVFSNATLSLVDWNKRRVGRVDIHEVIDKALDAFKPILTGRDIAVTTELAQGKPYLRGTESAIESILINLVNNSVTAFEQGIVSRRQLLIRTKINGSKLTLSVLDSGPGIQSIALADIWLPGQSTSPNGTGLGLTIVRDTARDLGGDATAIARSELGGAELTVNLPILGA